MNSFATIAVVLIIVTFVIVTTVFGVVVLGVKMQESRTNPLECDLLQAQTAAENYLKGTSTFRFDGIPGSIKPVKNEELKDQTGWKLTYSFQTAHPGHGDRSGLILAQVITDHTAVLETRQCNISSAICDNSWNLMTDQKEP
ncbi:MAG: hypothetical protein PHO26_00860 [Dehalococcoidia bacterium]|nr:hypothetical protein [Dehalococcoidia bacterium]MDD5493776.1 hypothetical protein [Dehalococcoidia bacterium]